MLPMILINPDHPGTAPGPSTSSVVAGLPSWTLWAVAAVIVLLVVLRAASKRSGRSFQTDPQRMFDGPQRAQLNSNAGGRCENKRPLWFRCRESGSQADHVHPWSQGGMTVVSNGAWLCRKCNAAKSDHVPSAIYIWRLERRRKNYFPQGVNCRIFWRPGERG